MLTVHLLLVEDSPQFAFLVERWLSRSSHIEARVEHARSIGEARELAALSRFDLVITDMGLPNGEGISTLSRIRLLFADTPMLVITGQPELPELTEAVFRHADGLLYKAQIDKAGGWLVGYMVELLVLRREVTTLRNQLKALQPRAKRRKMRWIQVCGEALGRVLKGLLK